VGGGPWFDTYNVVGAVDRVIPVDMYIPGCPPKPEAIIHGVAQLLKIAEKKIAPVIEAQETPEELGMVGHAGERAAE
jgi:NADH:ubiquinone oxidoreductase subunit B-like Fe-S oxidoreductase